ncbi:MAG: hypothetical protein M0D55_19960 [Elusimicrobiota bacterium]|nr:MAG: hypothetical protein M0D55_19960 [Elusimicrobiota bacterium]
MKLLAAALPLLVAVHAAAQVRVAPSAAALAWSGPLAAYTSELGAAGIARMDSVSLPRLTAPDGEGRLPLLKNPELLNPLAETLAEASVDPEGFAAMPLEFKETILRNAASLTEDRLAMKVWSVVQDTHKGIGRSAYADVARDARQARETSLYLNDRTMEGLGILEERVRKFEAAREEARREFLEDLPGKIAAGAFAGKNLLRAEDDGGRTVWTTGGDSPERAYATPEAALDVRLEALALMPAGPWSAAEAALLRASLDDAQEKGLIGSSRWTVAALNTIIEAERAGAPAAYGERLALASRRFARKQPTAGDVRAVERFYVDAYDGAGAWTLKAKILGAVAAGGRGLPSWNELLAARHVSEVRSLRRDLKAMLAGFAAALLLSALPVGVFLKSLPPVLAAAIAIGLTLTIIAPFVLVAASLLRRRGGLIAGSALSGAMTRYFSRRP